MSSLQIIYEGARIIKVVQQLEGIFASGWRRGGAALRVQQWNGLKRSERRLLHGKHFFCRLRFLGARVFPVYESRTLLHLYGVADITKIAHLMGLRERLKVTGCEANPGRGGRGYRLLLARLEFCHRRTVVVNTSAGFAGRTSSYIVGYWSPARSQNRFPSTGRSPRCFLLTTAL